MLILKGTKTVDLSKDELTEIIGQFDRVHIDLGTGDGRNIYIWTSVNNRGNISFALCGIT